jgi:GNAT superfamily N-acetyltransferase
MRLVVASDEEKRARDHVTHETWGGKLDVETWVAREERLRQHPWAQAAMTSWLWRDEDGQVLSSCETFAMPSSFAGTRGVTWAVASVYTARELRKRGHARRMMDALVARARAEGVQASTLYSDVGAPIYEASGYVARPAEDLVFPPAPGDPGSGVDLLLGEACAVEAPDEGFVLWPSAAQLDWHLERTRIAAAVWKRPALPSVGARAGESTIVWAVDWHNERLTVLLLDAARSHEAEALVQAARRTAGAIHLREVRLWAQPWPFVGRADLGGDRVARVGSLPMIAPLVPALRAEMWTHILRAVWV